jgi:hypothetical protein
MPPPSGFRVNRTVPDSRPALRRGGIRTSATGGWKMARRATSALAAALACTVVALPVVLAVGQRPAAAATADKTTQPPISIAITGMTPQWATSRSTITVKGTLHNNSRTAFSRPMVQLFGSSTPVTSIAEIQRAAGQPDSLASAPTGGNWQAGGLLRPDATTSWSIHIPASAIGMTSFGVYPVAAQAEDQFGNSLAVTTTYLPYEPDRKGAYASSRPAPAKIAWLWPLIDTPLLNEPWQGDCSGLQASALAQSRALAQSLGPGGRLAELASAGATDQNITWVIDPAVLANVQALTTCQSTQPRWAKAASAWLADLRSDTSGRPLTVTPYGDPNAAALFAVGHSNDVKRSFDLGRAVAGSILHRSLNPDGSGATNSTTSGTTALLTQAAGIAWSAADVPGYSAVEQLANVDSVSTLVLSSAAFPGGQYSVVRTFDGGQSIYMTALLASQSLTQLIGSASDAPGSAFSTSQQFLAETALLAQQVPAQPIIVAPPPRWAPSAALAADLIGDTATAPWLSQASLTALASAKHIPTVPNANWPAGTLGSTRITRRELRKLRTLDREITQLQGIRAHPDSELYLAVSALESSDLQGAPTSTVNVMMATIARRIANEQQAVRIIAEKRITLGGLKGSVPVSIDNRLGYPVRVELQLQYSQANGIKITTDPQGPITVPQHQTQTIRLRVQATGVGSTTVTMLLATQGGNPVSVPLRMTVQATQVGTLGMIIFAAALGVFLIASAARAVRRGRPGTGANEPIGDRPADGHDGMGSAEPAEADTVKAERAELGAVGKPGP